MQTLTERASDVAASVTDPELPMLTLLDLGVLRGVSTDSDGAVVVTITPTYSGCPAMATMRADLRLRLAAAGFERVDVRTTLAPPWSSDWITAQGRRTLAAHGISPPSAAPRRLAGPLPLTLARPPRVIACPQCGSADTEQTSQFGTTACRSLHRCLACRDLFDHVKEI